MTDGAENSKPPNTMAPVSPDLSLAELQDKVASIRKRLDAMSELNNVAATALEAIATESARRVRSWRMKAEELYASADNEDDPHIQARLRNLASNYEQLANEAEQRVRSARSRAGPS